MLRFTILMTLAVAVTSSLIDLEQEWGRFKDVHNKQYRNPKEEQYRRLTWESNREYIAKHNEGYKKGDFGFYLGENEYADMSNEEFTSVMNGYKQRMRMTANVVYDHTSHVGDLPTSVDWRTQGYVTPIKNQGQCGSCWAFSTTGSLEGQTFKKTGKLTSLSEQNLVDCSKKQGNHGCEGGLMDQAFSYIKQNNGIDTEASYPYEGKDAACRFQAANVGANDTGFVDVKAKDENALKSAVAAVGPIAVAIDANHITFQLYSGGVYHNIFCSQEKLDHGVLAVGYGTDQGKDYWMVKNSWGNTWGMQGYIMMSRNRNNNCGIASQASYPTV